MPENYYVTTPIYYVNDKPHIGHSYTTMLADVLTRFHAAMGEDTFFLTGTDEHGQKVQKAAEQRHMAPLAHCDETVIRFQELWKRLGIHNSDFIRTTQERHKKIVCKILQELFDKGLIYKAEYRSLLCPLRALFHGKGSARRRALPRMQAPDDQTGRIQLFLQNESVSGLAY